MNKCNTINETVHGRVFRCASCHKIHVEFKNLNLNFDDIAYKCFASYIENLNGELCEYKNRNSSYNRKIVLDVGHQSLNILLNNSELEELKRLLCEKPNLEKDYIIMTDKSLFVMDFLN